MFRMFFTTLLLVLRCVPSDVLKATGSSLVVTKEKLSLQSRIHIILEEEEDKEEESPSFSRCRPLCRVAGSGPRSKVIYPFISTLPSLMLYPRMCGHGLEPDSRPGLSVPAGTLPASGLPRRLRYLLGPCLPLQPPKELHQGPTGMSTLLRTSTSREQPNKGSAEDLEQPIKLQQGVPQLQHWLSRQMDVPVKPLRVHEELGYFNVDHFRSGCYYDDGNFAGGSDFNDDTFDDR